MTQPHDGGARLNHNLPFIVWSTVTKARNHSRQQLLRELIAIFGSRFVNENACDAAHQLNVPKAARSRC
jgi:hypothetical protein